MLHVDEVHRPTEPPAQAVVASEQLGHRAVERRPLCDRVPVGTVPGVHGVVVAKLRADRCGDSLLTHARVDQAVGLVGAREPADGLLEQPDPPHRGEQAERLRAVERQPRHRSGGHERRPTTRTESPSSCRHDGAYRPSLQLASTPGDRRVRIGFDPDIPLSTRPW